MTLFRNAIMICIASLVLLACGDNALYSENKNHFLSDKIFIAKDTTGIVYDSLLESDSIYMDRESRMFFRVQSFAGENPILERNLPEYYFFRYWQYGRNIIAAEALKIRANPDIKELCFYSIDNIGDTLKICKTIFIDNPISITNANPANMETGLSKEDSIEFTLNVDGLDPWETSTCQLYLAKNPRELWKAPIGKPFACAIGNKIWLKETQEDIYYWAVSAKIESPRGSIDLTTEPTLFSVKPDNKKNICLLPIRYQEPRSQQKSALISILDEGNAIKEFEINSDTTLYIEDLQENKNYVVQSTETIRKDYSSEPVEFTVIKDAYTFIDTLKLQDSYAPEAFPIKKSFARGDSIRFFVSENGSGLNALRTAVIHASSGDSLPYRYKNSKISFILDCSSPCKILVHTEDNAKNASADKFWKLTFGADSISIDGPFLGARE